MKIIECVPNFSEGCDKKKIAAIAKVFKSHSGVRLIDFSGDTDHNRSVFTFLGKPADILEAALAACGKALELIDMRKQSGVHPRLGAVDVVPFIPLGKTNMKDAVAIAHLFGGQLCERFGVPVYFYGDAAIMPGRKELADVRRGGYEALKSKMINPADAPDVGKPVFNARAGATAVGARELLVAYNINLDCADLRLAQKIASQIREKGGGLKHVRAIGVILKSRGIAQVSINLTNCKETPLKAIYDEVKTLAAERDIEILESELIGLIPKCAFAGTTSKYLKLKDFDKQRLLETHLKAFSG
ncbi:MAG: glutamate formimidoyltransferase [Deltaproteobacteria bacterium RBG_19FT_COMBO_43_11]|nr:MAG: glutamate formimidoyltransferase [Deltaproteobacteria bacterium RBG_19FT_COMBO_43_11]